MTTEPDKLTQLHWALEAVNDEFDHLERRELELETMREQLEAQLAELEGSADVSAQTD